MVYNYIYLHNSGIHKIAITIEITVPKKVKQNMREEGRIRMLSSHFIDRKVN